MKIAFLVGKFPSISETFVLDQITGLIEGGHTVDIYAEYDPEEGIIQENVKKYGLEEKVCYYKPTSVPGKFLKLTKSIISNIVKNPRKFLTFANKYLIQRFFLKRPLNVSRDQWIQIWQHLKWMYLLDTNLIRKNYDIVHCHFGDNGILGAYLKEWGLKSKLVTTFYGYDLSNFPKTQPADVYSLLFESADLIIPICEFFEKKLVKMGCSENKIKIHHLGVDLERFSKISNEIKGDSNVITLLSIGRFIEKKGMSYSIKAISKLIKKHPQISLLIVGDGPLRNSLHNLAHRLNLKQNIKFLGYLDRDGLKQAYEKAQIFILPSITGKDGDTEGTPTVLLEAQAMRLPVVSTFHAGIPELIEDEVSGYLVPEKDIEELATAIEKLILDEELRQRMGNAGYKKVDKDFNIKKLNLQLIEFYQTLILEK